MDRVISFLTSFYSWLFHFFINSNHDYLRMKSFYTKLLDYQNKTKSRFDLNQVKLSANLDQNGVIPHVEEQIIEYPNHDRNERLVIYGTNSSNDLLIVRLETRNIKGSSLIRGHVLLKHGSQIYKFDEIDWNNQKYVNKYKIKGLMVEIISPLRKLRIKFRGLMNVHDRDNQEQSTKFITFNFFWSPFSNAIDSKHAFDAKFMAKDLSETCSRNLMKKVDLSNFFEDRYEQFGQLIGLVNFDIEDKEMYLWGSRYKIFITDHLSDASETKENDDQITKDQNVCGPCQSMRLLAISPLKGPALSAGYVSNSKCSYRYGSGFTIPPLAWTMTETSITGQDFDQLVHLENNGKERTFSVSAVGKRNFDIKVTNLERIASDIVFGSIELKGCPAKCVLIDERNGLLYDSVPSWLKPVPKLMSLDLSKSDFDAKKLSSTEYIYSLTDVSGGHETISGGKGSSLIILTEVASSLLSKVPFQVPKGVIVSTKSYQKLLKNSPEIKEAILNLQNKVWSSSTNCDTSAHRKVDYEEESLNVINKFKQSSLPDVIKECLRRKLHRIFGDFEQIKFSVRSSAVGEDSEDMSAAGQMETFLGVQGIDNIINCILKCWASQFTLIAINYRFNYGQLIDVNMSVVIQEMIDCDVAGVMFTADPVNGNEGKIIITSNYGLGESVVSGQVEPDTVTLDIDVKKRQVEGVGGKVIGSKKELIKVNEDEKDANNQAEDRLTSKQLVDEDKSSVCSINDEDAIKLGRIGLLLHDIWQCPRDVEWGMKDGHFYLFQSRPVTNLDKLSNWELMHEMDTAQATEKDYVTRANVGEVLPGAISHLCQTFVVNGWGTPGFTRFRKILGLTDDMFVPYILSFFAVVYNTFFINIKNKHFGFGTEDGAGTEYAIIGRRLTDEEYLQDCREYYEMEPKSRSKIVNMRLASFLFKEVLTSKRNLERATKKFGNLNLVPDDQNGNQLGTSEQLFDHIINNSWKNNHGMLIHYQVTQCSMISSQILRSMLFKANPDMDAVLVDMSTILGSCTDVVSAGVPTLIRDITNSIDDKESFRSLSDEDALQYIRENEKTREKFEELIQNFGHRGLKEFDLATKVWAMDPMPLVKSIKGSVSRLKPKDASDSAEDKESEDSLDKILDTLNTKTSGTLRRILKHVVIPFARASVGWREKSKSFTIKLIHEYRKAFWHLARIMAQKEGRIPDPELLFHLKLEEVQILVKNRDPILVEKAAKRRKLWKVVDKYKFDEILKGPSIKPRSDKPSLTVPNDGCVSIKGTPVCAGKVEARICVVMSLDDAADIQEGDILITYSTDIGWSPFFPLLSGLATEIGGLVSHGAVIAREFGLPCLVGVHGAPSLFKTGDRGLLDSVNGVLTKL